MSHMSHGGSASTEAQKHIRSIPSIKIGVKRGVIMSALNLLFKEVHPTTCSSQTKLKAVSCEWPCLIVVLLWLEVINY